MKKILIMMFVAVAATNINAQLVVDSLGRVGIGTESPKSLLSVGPTAGDSLTAIHCHSTNKLHGVHLKNTYNTIYTTTGLYSRANNISTGNSIGIDGNATGGNNMNTYQLAIGVSGRSGNVHTGIGVYGGRYTGSESPVNFAGVYGADRDYQSFSDYPGVYAGYFFGMVRATHGVYGPLFTPSVSASQSEQTGTTILSDRSESVTDKLNQVQAVQFLRHIPTAKTRVTIPKDEIDNMSIEDMDSLADAKGNNEPEPYLSPIQYGLDADQLKAVYPELVYEDDNGNVSINYVEMVPLLVQSIKELSAKVAELEGTSPKKAKRKGETTAIEDNVSDVDMVRMDQNKPNPFSESTVITLNIPEQTQKASIFIYDMSGKQIQNIAVSERGKTNITVYASDLTAGMYIYTLVVDGKVAVTRRMIVEK